MKRFKTHRDKLKDISTVFSRIKKIKNLPTALLKGTSQYSLQLSYLPYYTPP